MSDNTTGAQLTDSPAANGGDQPNDDQNLNNTPADDQQPNRGYADDPAWQRIIRERNEARNELKSLAEQNQQLTSEFQSLKEQLGNIGGLSKPQQDAAVSMMLDPRVYNSLDEGERKTLDRLYPVFKQLIFTEADQMERQRLEELEKQKEADQQRQREAEEAGAQVLEGVKAKFNGDEEKWNKFSDFAVDRYNKVAYVKSAIDRGEMTLEDLYNEWLDRTGSEPAPIPQKPRVAKPGKSSTPDAKPKSVNRRESIMDAALRASKEVGLQ